jgi:hypothetical protein
VAHDALIQALQEVRWVPPCVAVNNLCNGPSEIVFCVAYLEPVRLPRAAEVTHSRSQVMPWLIYPHSSFCLYRRQPIHRPAHS